MPQNLFTYGTLMVPEVFNKVVGRTYPTCKGTLSGYMRYRVAEKSYPGIIQEDDRSVQGVVYLGVNSRDLERLDRFEGNIYEAREVIVKTETDIMLNALAYVIKPVFEGLLSEEQWVLEEFIKTHLKEFLRFEA